MLGQRMRETKLTRKKRKWIHTEVYGDEMHEQKIVQRLTDCFSTDDPAEAIENLEILLAEFHLTDFNSFLAMPEVLNFFQVDIFWIIHMSGFLIFSDYISIVEESTVVRFVRTYYLEAAQASDPKYSSNYNSLSLSFCAAITLYIFGMTGRDVNCLSSSEAVTKKVDRILNNLFLPDVSDGPLQPSDVQLFCDLLATISCSIEREAVQELQIQQISRILDHNIENFKMSSEIKRGEIDSFEDLHSASDDELSDEKCHNLVWCSFDPFECLRKLNLPVIVFLKAFDRALRADICRSPFDVENGNSLSTSSAAGMYSVLSQLLENAPKTSLLTWKSSPPQAYNMECVARHADTIGLSEKSNANSTSRSSSGSFPIVCILHLATACARAGITESSHTLWLRSVRLMELLCDTLQYPTPQGGGDPDPGTYLFADWLDFILGSRTGFNNILAKTNYDLYDDQNNVDVVNPYEGDMGGGLPWGTDAAVTNAKTLKFACLSLCEAIPHQKESILQATCHALHARRTLEKDAVDLYLLAAREQLGKIDLLKASHTKRISGVQAVALSVDRVLSWAGTLRRTGWLPAGVFQTCKMAGTHGHQGLLRALTVLMGSNPSIRESALNIVAAMATSEPPLCSAADAKIFKDGDGRGSGHGRSITDAFLGTLAPSPRVLLALKAALNVITHACSTIAQKGLYLPETRDFMLLQWKQACIALLDSDAFTEIESQRIGQPSARRSSAAEGSLNQLRAASAICTSFYEMLSLLVDKLEGSQRGPSSSSSSSSSSISSSSSSSSSSSRPDPINDPSEFLPSWCSFSRAVLSLLLSCNGRLITGILAATIACDIKDKVSLSISPLPSSSTSSSCSLVENLLRVDVPLLLHSVPSDSELRAVLDLVMTQLLSNTDSTNPISELASNKGTHQRRLLIFCEYLYSTLMLHMTVRHTSKTACRLPGSLDPAHGISPTQLCADRVDEIVRSFPFLCGLFVWLLARCACFPFQDLHVLYGTSSTLGALNHWGLLAAKIEHRILSTGEGGADCVGDAVAEAAVRTLSSEELMFFLRWECSGNSSLYVRSTDRGRVFHSVWCALFQGHIAAITDSLQLGGNCTPVRASVPSFPLAREPISVAVPIPHTAKCPTRYAVLGAGLLSSPCPMGMTSGGLKSVWKALIGCSVSLSDWVACDPASSSYSPATTTSPFSSSLHGSRSGNRSDGGVVGSTGGCWGDSPFKEGGVGNSGKEAIPYIAQDVLYVLVRSLMQASSGARLSSICCPYCTDSEGAHSLWLEQARSVWVVAAKAELDSHDALSYRAQVILFLVRNVLTVPNTMRRTLYSRFQTENGPSQNSMMCRYEQLERYLRLGPLHRYNFKEDIAEYHHHSYREYDEERSSVSSSMWWSWLLCSVPDPLREVYTRTLSPHGTLDLISGGNSSLSLFPCAASNLLFGYPLYSSRNVLLEFQKKKLDRLVETNILPNEIRSESLKVDKRMFLAFLGSESMGEYPRGNCAQEFLRACVGDLKLFFFLSSEKIERKEELTQVEDESSDGGVGRTVGKDQYIHLFDGDWLAFSMQSVSPRMGVKRDGWGKQHLQMGLARVLGWGLLSCFCSLSSSPVPVPTVFTNRTDRGIGLGDDAVGLQNDGSGGARGGRGLVLDIGHSAVCVQNLIGIFLRKADQYTEQQQLKDGGLEGKSKVMSINTRGELGGVDPNGPREGGQIPISAGLLPDSAVCVAFLASLLGSCLILLSNVGAMAGRSASNSARDSLRNLAAAVGPIVTTALVSLVGVGLREEKESQGGAEYVHVSAADGPACLAGDAAPPLSVCRGAIQGSKLQSYVTALNDLVLRLIRAELETQIPAAVISDVSSTLDEMMQNAMRSEEQRERIRLARK